MSKVQEFQEEEVWLLFNIF